MATVLYPIPEADAYARLSDMVARTVFPELSNEQMARLLQYARREDAYGWLPSYDIEWTPNTVYALNDVIVPPIRNGHTYIISDGGTSGTTEPDWPLDVGDEVTLDGVTYMDISSYVSVWYGRWDFNRAAAEGWRVKAGMVSNRHDFGSNQGNYNPSQLFEHCNKMAEVYAAKTVGAIALETGRWDGTGRIPGAHLEDAV